MSNTMDNNNASDDVLVQKLMSLNQRLNDIASTNNSSAQLTVCHSPVTGATSFEPTNLLPPPPVGNTNSSSLEKKLEIGRLQSRLKALEDHIEKINSKLHSEQNEKQRLDDLLKAKQLQNVDNESNYIELTNNIANLKNKLTIIQQQLEAERERYMEAMKDYESQLIIFKSDHSSYQSKLENKLEKERLLNKKVEDVTNANEELQRQINALKAKLKHCDDRIKSKDKSNELLMNNLKKEKFDLLGVIKENEKNSAKLSHSVEKISKENKILESKVEDRDQLHERLIRNKRQYENALGDLLSAKKDQSELENTLKDKLVALRNLERKIVALQKEREQLLVQIKDADNGHEKDLNDVKLKYNANLSKLQSELNYMQIKYNEMKTKHLRIQKSIQGKAALCQELKNNIDAQKKEFENQLTTLIKNHYRKLDKISKDSSIIREVLGIMEDVNQNNRNAKIKKEINVITTQTQVITPVATKTKAQMENDDLGLDENEKMALGLWEPC